MSRASRSIRRRDFVARAGAGLAASAASLQLAAPSQSEASSGEDGLTITDFQRSCLRFRIDTTKKAPKTASRKLPMTLNNVRMLLDARAVITHKASGRVHDYVLTASCKSEQVWVRRDIWHRPNADMCMLAGPDEFLVYKRWDKADKGVMLYPPSLGVQPERQLDDPKQCFDRFSINRVTRPGRVLGSVDAIIEALSTDMPMVAQTQYDTPDFRVLLEYPVKVVNFSERERYYQVDTGPILLPDFDSKYRSLLEGCRLAYVAHNGPEWAEFIVCVPTRLTDTIAVHHYSRSIRIEGTCNRMIAVA